MRVFIAVLSVAMMIMANGCGSKDLKGMQFSGTFEMTEHQLGVQTAGRIATMSVEEGDHVKAGQEIATLGRYEQSKKDFKRAQLLFKQGGANRQAVEYAQLAMEDQRVIAPIDGIILVKIREAGEVISTGAAVAVLGDPQDQWVKIFIPEGNINQVRIGQTADIAFDGVSKIYKGRVTNIATKAEFTPRNVQTQEERVTQAFAVKVGLDDPDVRAHPGVSADVKFENIQQ